MKNDYIETLIKAPSELHDILVALLAEVGYEAFEEEAHQLKAFIQESIFNEDEVGESLLAVRDQIEEISHSKFQQKNWNEVWESNYESVEIGTFLQAVPTHRKPKKGFVHTLHMDPKMAFGTGHHHTTRLMVMQMEDMVFDQKSVLDMGCGTGILAILAKRMGANPVWAIDIDPWSEENCRENAKLNQVSGIEIALGDVTAIPQMHYDVILANINRNVLLADIPAYSRHLNRGSLLVMSGFYNKDLQAILEVAESVGLKQLRVLEENDWLSLKLVKERD